MGVNKVDLSTGETLIDISNDTVTPETLAEGVTAHNAEGNHIVGTMTAEGGGSGIIEVPELPTENIDENAVYRVTESVQTEKTEIYIVRGGNAITVQQFLIALGVYTVPNIYVVDELPSDMKEFDILTASEVHFYIVKSDGIVYVYIPDNGGVITGGSLVFQAAGYDKGFTENIYNETEDGVYTTLEAYEQVEKWFVRDNGEWKRISPDTQTKEVTFTENGNYEVIPDSGKQLSKASVKVKVPVKEEQPKAITITENGTKEVTPDSGKTLSKVTVEVSVPTQGGSDDNLIKGIVEGKATEIILPDTIIKVKNYAFYDQIRLTNFQGNGVTSIGDYGFNGCTNLAITSLPPNLISLGISAFSGGCNALNISEFPASLTSIGNYCFQGSTGLKSIKTTSPSLTLGTYVFKNCTKLTKVDLAAVTKIQTQDFYGCTALKTLILRQTDNIVALGATNAFTSVAFTGIYVPSALLETYKTATNWSTYSGKFKAIEDYPDICG